MVLELLLLSLGCLFSLFAPPPVPVALGLLPSRLVTGPPLSLPPLRLSLEEPELGMMPFSFTAPDMLLFLELMELLAPSDGFRCRCSRERDGAGPMSFIGTQFTASEL